MMYKVGDIIGHRTISGTYLCEIDYVYMNDNSVEQIDVKYLYDENLIKVKKNKSILLPQQRYEVLSKEEYFEYMQNEINRKQNLLNRIKGTI